MLLSLETRDRKSVTNGEERHGAHLDDGSFGRDWNASAKTVAADLSGPAAQRHPPARRSRLNEQFKAADLSDLAQCEAICEGVDGIIHFGGYSVEGPWNDILQANIIGGYNLFEAAYRKGVKRVVFASSNPPSASIRATTRSAPT